MKIKSIPEKHPNLIIRNSIFRDFFWFREKPRNMCFLWNIEIVISVSVTHFLFYVPDEMFILCAQKTAQNGTYAIFQIASKSRFSFAVLCFFVLLIAILILTKFDFLKFCEKFNFASIDTWSRLTCVQRFECKKNCTFSRFTRVRHA
jgi:hypothetical protein